MRTTLRSLAEKFHGVVDRMVAALHQQRAIEAQRVLQRYRHLLDVQHEASPLKQVIVVVSHEEDFSENAHQSDTRERSARPSLERA